MNAEIGIIGGTGVYDPDILKDKQTVDLDTPFGKPSDSYVVGDYEGRKVAILSRHGQGHSLAPHKIKYRANIHGFKQLGVKYILSPCSVGSLQDNVTPGEIVFVDQFIDRTWGRESTFYGKDKVCHISVADPTCKVLRELGVEKAKELGIPHHPAGTYVCIQGPRFSTRAESQLYRSWNAHVIGMTMVPECVLAREAEICFVSIAMVTDYDSFKEKAVSIQEIISTMKNNLDNVKNIITKMIPDIPEERTCECATALKDAFV